VKEKGMLRSVNELKAFSLQAADGEIGAVVGLYFDERHWQVRYLVVDVGNWLFGRKVLIAPSAVESMDAEAPQLTLALTKERIENSPDIDTAEPISRREERALHEHFQWWPYWGAGLTDPVISGIFPPDIVAAPAVPPPEEAENAAPTAPPEDENYLRSTSEIEGYQIQAEDGVLGSVVDFLFDDQTWQIRHLVVATGSDLPVATGSDLPVATGSDLPPPRQVLLAPPWIKAIQWRERRVIVALTQENLRHNPAFDAAFLNAKEYEKQLLGHYRVWFSQLLEKADEQGA
jgi:uncharacterized protein YrrD